MSTSTGGELGPFGAGLVAWIGAGYAAFGTSVSFEAKALVVGVLFVIGAASILEGLRG